MQSASHSASTTSPVRRSSRAASRKNSSISLSQGSRAGSRRESSLNQFADFNLDLENVNWNELSLLNLLNENPDVFAGLQDPHGGFLPQADDNATNPMSQFIEDGTVNFEALPEPTRQSINLLQYPLSALPGTPNAVGFNHCLTHAPQYPYNSVVYSQGREQIQYDWTEASPNRPRLQLSGVTTVASTSHPSLQLSGVTMVASTTPKPLTAACGGPAFPRQLKSACAPLRNNQFVGYIDNDESFDYPDPIDPRIFGAHREPYYRGGQYELHGHDRFDKVQSITSPGVGSSQRRRSQSHDIEEERSRSKGRKTVRSGGTASFSANSDSTYPDRSRSGSAEAHHTRRPTRHQVQKRKSVFEDPFQYEMPKTDPEKAWIRTNGTTKGLTTRTAKCNNYDPRRVYTYTPHPVGDWSSSRYDFKYTPEGEWKETLCSANYIKDFILKYPEDKMNGRQLRLLIQVGPTDSARRYLSQTWSKCRFRDCPANIVQNGTILHGHYRVAFDERTFGDPTYDPHLAAGAYVHLYCMERFLDFPYICKKAHVFVDNRQISTEPKGKFAATLAGHPECNIAETFLDYAREGQVRDLEEFKHYPLHEQFRGGKPKPHEFTLTCRMHEDKAKARPPAQLRQFQERGLTASHLLVNKGDLEVHMQETLRKKALSKAKGKKRRAEEIEEGNDDEDLPGDQDLEYKNKRRRLVAEAKKIYTPTQHKPLRTRTITRSFRKSPKAGAPEPWNVSDDEDDDQDYAGGQTSNTQASRRSARTAARNRPDYREEPEVHNQQQANAVLHTYDGYVPADAYNPSNIGLSSNILGDAHDAPGVDVPGVDPSARRRSSVGPFVDPSLEGIDLDAYFAAEGLNRRTSSLTAITQRASSILSSPGLRNGSLGQRHASFNKQPVTREQTFDIEAPPQDVEIHDQLHMHPNTRSGNVFGVKSNGRKVSKRRSK